MRDKRFLEKEFHVCSNSLQSIIYAQVEKLKKEKKGMSKSSKAQDFEDAAESVLEPAVQSEIDHELALEIEPNAEARH